MTDILARLRERADGVDQFYGSSDEELDKEAIAEIQKLRAALSDAAEWLAGEGLDNQADAIRKMLASCE
jgi:hypothetical protein